MSTPNKTLSIHVGALAPYKLEMVIGSDTDGFDLTVCPTGAFELLRAGVRKDAPPEIWSGVVSEPASTDAGTQLTLTHTYLAGDLPEAGTIYVRGRLDHPEGPVYSRWVPLLVN